MTRQTIIGGGIIGLMTAYYLVKSGEKVTILERGNIGQESSWAGGGIISPLYPWRYAHAVSALVRWSQMEYPALVEELECTTGLSAEYTTSGLLILDEQEVVEAQSWAAQYAADIRVVSSSEIGKIEPALANIPRQALWLPSVAQVRNPRLVKMLKRYLLIKGAEIIENIEVNDFHLTYNKIHSLLTSQGELNVDNVIVSCGAWSASLLNMLGATLQIEPVKGQMLLYKSKPGLIRAMILKNGHYVIPRLDGRVLVGSTMEYVGFNKDITEQAYDSLSHAATELVPILAEFELERQWAGLRPGSEDNIPTICRQADIAGLYINAGHFRNGVVTAPASAKLLCDIILEQQPIIDPQLYLH